MSPAPAMEKRRFDRPDQSLDMKTHGRIDVIKMADGSAGMHAILEPGWTWAADEKPLLGNPDSCPMDHTGYCIGGHLVVRMVASGSEMHVQKGDFFTIPAGHDAYVDGAERVELILFGAPSHER
ncbi:MAG TPA: cupin domain-containing protein [Candidatus Polarisedimenticolia bacterium]|nr:cupin domain-containing protein [Candidatus Polarisedimenticolia bacterium]